MTDRSTAELMTPDAFRETREALGYTQAQLAEALDITRQTVNRYERGREPIPRVVVMALELLRRKVSRRPPLA